MITLLSSIVFSVIDALFFLLGEEKIQNTLDKIKYIDHNSAELITGGLSAAISILFFGYFKQYLTLRFKIQEHPIIDAIGILLGTTIVVLIYTLFKFFKH